MPETMALACNFNTQEQDDCYELEATLGYIVSFQASHSYTAKLSQPHSQTDQNNNQKTPQICVLAQYAT